jgi:hypothetical protein
MNSLEKKTKLHEYIENGDEQVVEILYLFIQGQKALHEEFLKNYNREIDEAMASIDKGFFSTHEDVEKEAEKW